MEISCHCKNIKIQAELPSQITSCNCSICSRYNTLWGYYSPDAVEIEVGKKGEAFYIWGGTPWHEVLNISTTTIVYLLVERKEKQLHEIPSNN